MQPFGYKGCFYLYEFDFFLPIRNLAHASTTRPFKLPTESGPLRLGNRNTRCNLGDEGKGTRMRVLFSRLIYMLMISVGGGDVVAQDKAQQPSVIISGVKFETSIGPFELGNVINNESRGPGLGRTIAYHGGSYGEATVYVYDLQLTDIPDRSMSAIVRTEFDRATHDVFRVAQHTGSEAKLLKRYGTGSPDRGHEFLCAEFQLIKDGISKRSFLYLTAANNNFVKIRISLPDKKYASKIARSFADQVASSLW